MPKILIVQACTVPGESVSRHADINDVVDVTRDDAVTLTRLGRARYVSRDDDHTKGALTATAEDRDLAKRAAAAIKAARESRSTVQSTELAAAVAAELARLGIASPQAPAQASIV